MAKLTKEEALAYWNAVQKLGEEREEVFGKKFSQADFVAGACCILAHLDQMDLFPPKYFFGVMRGDKLFKKDNKKAKATQHQK